MCKFFITELKSRLEESGKSKEIIRTGHGLDKSKSFPYGTSYVAELFLIVLRTRVVLLLQVI